MEKFSSFITGGLVTAMASIWKSYPKQFSKLLGKRSLFQESIHRVTSSKKLKFKKPITLTNFDYRFIIKEQFAEIEMEHASILIEPESKNTAPAILAMCFYIAKENPEAILLVHLPTILPVEIFS